MGKICRVEPASGRFPPSWIEDLSQNQESLADNFRCLDLPGDSGERSPTNHLVFPACPGHNRRRSVRTPDRQEAFHQIFDPIDGKEDDQS